MYSGVWLPSQKTNNNILILGESHYEDIESQGKTASYTTSDVIESYLSGKSKIKFFSSIAQSFGYYNSEIKDFYSKVYFGNYVDELCGVGEWNNAKGFIEDNRLKYNEELFKFCNDYNIKFIVCFSILCYNALPMRESYEIPQEEIYVGKIGQKPNYIRKFTYRSGKRQDCNVSLNNDLIVYGIRHPSSQSGYSVEQVYQFFINDKNLDWIIN